MASGIPLTSCGRYPTCKRVGKVALKTGPESLDDFGDRILYHLVTLTGNLPLPLGSGVTDEDLAPYLADDLGLASDDISTSIATGAFHSTDVRGIILAGVDELVHEGLVDGEIPWFFRPTPAGRRRVGKWREDWQRQRRDLDQKIQQRILEELDRQYRADHDAHTSTGRVDVTALCHELDVTSDDYRANVEGLLEQGKIARSRDNRSVLDDGFAYITDAGITAVEAKAAAARPQRDAQEAWVEVARLRRQLEIAQRTHPSLIRDEELRRRCEDLLAAGAHYDRVVREACVILENRVRVAIGADKDVVGTTLMERAFSAKSGLLQLSRLDQEQVGAMQLYRGVMAFFRNDAGHHLIDTYSQEDALRLVAWIDLLL